MKIYILYGTLKGIGGQQLLIEKLARRFVKEGYLVVILHATSDSQMLKRLEATGAILQRVENWKSPKPFAKIMEEDKNAIAITFSWKEYIKIQSIKNQKITTLLYTIQFEILLAGSYSSNFFKQKVAKRLMYPIIRDGIESKNIFCMDEQTVNCTTRHYNEKLPKADIIRIPVDYAKVLRKEKVSNRFNILSIARADFPFKGYLLGLIEMYAKMKQDYPWITLTIVSYGDDIERLKEQIQQVKEYAKGIKLVGRTDFDQLEAYYRDADLYIGMGTTVLDAALRGILTLPVMPNEEKVYVSQWFHEDPYVLEVDKELQKLADPLQKITEAIHMSDKEYQEYAKLSHKLAVENYDTGIISQKIIEIAKQASKNKPSILIRCLSFYMNR